MAETVSVLIASYNCARFLPQCLDSISAQTRKPDEVIVVDDGSEDDTAEVMRRFSAVRYIRNPHGGKSAAFNRAIKEARGDILCHLDADDYWMPRKLERICRELADRPTIGGVIHETEDVGEDGRPIKRGRKTRTLPMPAVTSLDNSEEVCFLGLSAGNSNTTVTRRSALVDLFPLWPDMGLAVDGIFVYGALRYGLLYLPELLSAYRHHGNNAWVGNPRRFQDLIQMTQFLLLKEDFLGHLSARQIRLLRAKILELTAFHSSLTGDNKIRGAIAGIQVPFVLLRNGILFNWRHLALPLTCLLHVDKKTSSRTGEKRLAVGHN